MCNYENLRRWLVAPAEVEGLEFKEAKITFSKAEVARYTAAIGNEGGGWLVLGVTDKPPRTVVGTSAFIDDPSRNKLKQHVYDKLRIAIEVHVIDHEDGQVVAISIPSRPRGETIDYEGQHLIRVGESVQAMPPSRLREIYAELRPHWTDLPAKRGCDPSDVIELLDTAAYFELRGEPYPTTRDAVIDRLISDGLIHWEAGELTIPNLSAITLAKRLADFSFDLAAKAPRFIHYIGVGKTATKNEIDGERIRCWL